MSNIIKIYIEERMKQLGYGFTSKSRDFKFDISNALNQKLSDTKEQLKSNIYLMIVDALKEKKDNYKNRKLQCIDIENDLEKYECIKRELKNIILDFRSMLSKCESSNDCKEKIYNNIVDFEKQLFDINEKINNIKNEEIMYKTSLIKDPSTKYKNEIQKAQHEWM